MRSYILLSVSRHFNQYHGFSAWITAESKST